MITIAIADSIALCTQCVGRSDNNNKVEPYNVHCLHFSQFICHVEKGEFSHFAQQFSLFEHLEFILFAFY